MSRQGLVPRPRGGVRWGLGMPVAQDSWFGKAEGESGMEEYTGRAEAGDDLQLYAAVRSVFKAVAELALGGDLILM